MGEMGLVDVMVEKGAIGVIGWDEAVSIEQSDRMILRLMESSFEGTSLGETVEEINRMLDDPVRMVYYPESLSGFKVFEP